VTSALILIALSLLFSGVGVLCYKEGQGRGYRDGWNDAVMEVMRRNNV
jgi:hypothetical protein